MPAYEVTSTKTGYSFGYYRAASADGAIEACCRDAGYESRADAEKQTGHAVELTSDPFTINQRSLDDDA